MPQVIGVLGVGQDITERKKVEMEKANVAQELQAFIDTANAPIFGIDLKGMVNEWNSKSVEITGFTREEVMGKSMVDVYISEEFRESVKSVFDAALNLDSVTSMFDDALDGKGTANFELPIFTVDQRRVEVLLNATTRCNVKGEMCLEFPFFTKDHRRLEVLLNVTTRCNEQGEVRYPGPHLPTFLPYFGIFFFSFFIALEPRVA